MVKKTLNYSKEACGKHNQAQNIVKSSSRTFLIGASWRLSRGTRGASGNMDISAHDLAVTIVGPGIDKNTVTLIHATKRSKLDIEGAKRLHKPKHFSVNVSGVMQSVEEHIWSRRSLYSSFCPSNVSRSYRTYKEHACMFSGRRSGLVHTGAGHKPVELHSFNSFYSLLLKFSSFWFPFWRDLCYCPCYLRYAGIKY